MNSVAAASEISRSTPSEKMPNTRAVCVVASASTARDRGQTSIDSTANDDSMLSPTALDVKNSSESFLPTAVSVYGPIRSSGIVNWTASGETSSSTARLSPATTTRWTVVPGDGSIVTVMISPGSTIVPSEGDVISSSSPRATPPSLDRIASKPIVARCLTGCRGCGKRSKRCHSVPE